VTEDAVMIPCHGGEMVGILHSPSIIAEDAIPTIVVVGGPQTRVGSHRQFVLLARSMCNAGVPVLRFDYCGMGDTCGEVSNYLEGVSDLASAVDFMADQIPGRNIALWGLCDAASLLLLYMDAKKDARVSTIIALNPWVRQCNTEARVILKNYYLRRVTDLSFWRKLLKFDLDIFSAFGELLGNLKKAYGRTAFEEINKDALVKNEKMDNPVYRDENFVEGMQRGLESFNGAFHLIMSGQDLTADEFRLLLEKNSYWKSLIDSKLTDKLEVSEANHTFSTAAWREMVEEFTINCVKNR